MEEVEPESSMNEKAKRRKMETRAVAGLTPGKTETRSDVRVTAESNMSARKGFQKGQSGNPKGREPGSKNVRTQQWEEFGKAIIEGNLDWMQEQIDSLKAKQPAAAFGLLMDLMEYFKPKLSRTELKAPPGSEVTYKMKFK